MSGWLRQKARWVVVQSGGVDGRGCITLMGWVRNGAWVLYHTMEASPICAALQGWGVVAAQHIPAGSFVCQYVGELLSSTEAQGRLEAYDAAVAAAVAAGHDDIPGHALLVSAARVPKIIVCTTCTPCHTVLT
jgi:hypothetical protein